MANNQPNVNSCTNITMLREYRKGNWTVQETMVLIEAKKMDEERRMKRSEGVKSSGGELRWKWVEDYCWRYGCLRSQNQCNDKWDNLMRDFKRVRDHQRRLLASQAEASSVGAEFKSYWDIDKLERKERSLPSSMLAEVYDALLEVVEKRSGGFKSSGGSDYSNVNNMVRTHAVLVQPVSNVMPLAPSEPLLMALPAPHSVDPPLVTVGEQVHCQRSVLLGDVGAGKSSLVLRFVKGQFVEFQESTIGAAFFSQTLAVNDATVKFEIWDTAGQERYHSLAPMYYRGAAAAIIVYDITNENSFDRAKKWIQELQAQGNPSMVMALAGNKADMLEARKVAAEDAQTYAQENGLFFMETSAKNATNVNEIFHEIAKRLPRVQPAPNPSGMVLSDRPGERIATNSCCSS